MNYKIREQFTHDIVQELTRYITHPKIVKINDGYDITKGRFYIGFSFEINRQIYLVYITEEVYNSRLYFLSSYNSERVQIGMSNIITEFNLQTTKNINAIFWKESIKYVLGENFFEVSPYGIFLKIKPQYIVVAI